MAVWFIVARSIPLAVGENSAKAEQHTILYGVDGFTRCHRRRNPLGNAQVKGPQLSPDNGKLTLESGSING